MLMSITSDLSNQLESPLWSLNFNQLLAWLLGFIALNLINNKDGDQKDIDVIWEWLTHSLIRSFAHPWNLRLLYPPSHSAVYHKFYSFTHNAIVKWCKCHSLCLLISPIMDGNIKFYITINFVCAARHMGNENDDSLNQFRTVFLKDICEFIKFSLQTVSIKNYFHLKARERKNFTPSCCVE